MTGQAHASEAAASEPIVGIGIGISIAEFAASARGIEVLAKPADDIDVPARAAAFRAALVRAQQASERTAQLHHWPDFSAIAQAPAWLALPVASQTRLSLVLGTLAHAASLALSLDGAMLRTLASRIGEAALDQIVQTADPVSHASQTSVDLTQIETDGQCILLATVPLALQAMLMRGIYFQHATADRIAMWRNAAAGLLARGAQL